MGGRAATGAGGVTADDVARAVSGRGYRFADEHGLHDLLVGALSHLGPVEREVVVPGAGRIDLAVGRVGVEVKVAGTPAAVDRQLARYRASGAFDAVVLVTTRPVHLSLSDPGGTVPLRVVVVLDGAF